MEMCQRFEQHMEHQKSPYTLTSPYRDVYAFQKDKALFEDMLKQKHAERLEKFKAGQPIWIRTTSISNFSVYAYERFIVLGFERTTSCCFYRSRNGTILHTPLLKNEWKDTPPVALFDTIDEDVTPKHAEQTRHLYKVAGQLRQQQLVFLLPDDGGPIDEEDGYIKLDQ